MIEHVVIVATWYPSELDPVLGTFVEEQARILARRYRVTVIAPDLRSMRVVPRHGFGRRLVIESRNGIDVVRPRVVSLVPRRARARARAYLEAVRDCLPAVTRLGGKPSILHAHVVLPGGWASVALGREIDVPVVLTEHSNPYSMHLKTAASRALVRQALLAAARCVAVSPGLAAEIEAFAPGVKVEVIGNVIDTDFFRPSDGEQPRPASEPFTFLSVGLLTELKGMHVLVEAAGLLARRGGMPFRLVIGGDGTERAALERQVRAGGLEGIVSFRGRLDRDGVLRELRGCDAFVLASRRETFGVVLGEALACGNRIVATRTRGAEFVLAGLDVPLVPVDDPRALAQQMTAVMAGDSPTDAASRRSSIVSRFGPDAFLARTAELYESLAQAASDRER